MGKVKIHVTYCGAWAIEAKFHDSMGDITITSEATPSSTGFLEVQVVGGPLLHSKKGGEGYVDSSEKMNKILDGIAAELSK